jgi:hypothetical protein
MNAGRRCERIRVVTRAAMAAKCGIADLPAYLLICEIANGGHHAINVMTAARVAEIVAMLEPTEGTTIHSEPHERADLIAMLEGVTMH